MPYPVSSKLPAVLVPRVSTKDQEEGHSIAAQRRRLEEYCAKQEMPVLRVFEIVESSTRGDRRRFHEMIDFVKAQRRKVAVVAETVDRMQRSFKESILLDELRRSGKVEVHFLADGLTLNENAAPDQILMWDFAVLRAKAYVTSLSHNVRRSLNYKLQTGEWIRHAPVGYLNVRNSTSGKGDVILDPDRAPLVRSLFERYASGAYSIASLADLLSKEGLTNNYSPYRPMSASSLYRVLSNPFYKGEMVIKGHRYPHRYPTMVSVELFDQCRRVRERFEKGHFTYAAKPFLFRGLIRCSYCDCLVSCERKKNRYTYLSCTKNRGACPGVRVREEVLIAQIEDSLSRLQVPEDVIAWLVAELSGDDQAARKVRLEAKAQLERERGVLARQRQTLLDLRLREQMDDAAFNSRDAELSERITGMDRKIATMASAGDSSQSGFELANLALELGKRALEVFRVSDVDRKRVLLGTVHQNLRLAGEKLLYEAKKPFDVLLESSNHSYWLGLVQQLRTACFAEPIASVESIRQLLTPVKEAKSYRSIMVSSTLDRSRRPPT